MEIQGWESKDGGSWAASSSFKFSQKNFFLSSRSGGEERKKGSNPAGK
jgi:hypothetical protein